GAVRRSSGARLALCASVGACASRRRNLIASSKPTRFRLRRGKAVAAINRLKAALKRGPRMSRQLRTEFTLCQFDAPPRQLRPELIAKIKPELQRLGQSGNPRGLQFLHEMQER